MYLPAIELKKYSPVNPILKKLIKFYWRIKSESSTTIQGKLLPMNNIDLIINLSTPVFYKSGTKDYCLQKSHFSGIQNNYRVVEQSGVIDLFGISFNPTGFFPLIKKPLAEFSNSIVITESVINGFEGEVHRIAELDNDSQRVSLIEDTLISFIDLNQLASGKYGLIANDFLLNGDSITINRYCRKHCICQKALLRFFNKFIGTTPKAFLMNVKLQKAMMRMKLGDFETMTQIGYEFDFYDQTHFIKSFKRFTGNTPANQLKMNDLIFDVMPK